ncbi:MAG: hypothetical protein ACFUZC_03925 [Chthoniobacteraceae bacterium]
MKIKFRKHAAISSFAKAPNLAKYTLTRMKTVALLLATCLSLQGAPEQSTNPPPEPIVFHTKGMIRRIPDTFFGVHDSRIYGIGRTKNHADPKLTEFIKEVGFQNLRGPDGTGANYYLWREGTVLTSPDDLRYGVFYGSRLLGGSLPHIKPEPGFPGLTLEDIYRPSRELNIPYVFVLNVSSQTVEEIATQVREMRKLTQFPVRVELGNELYAMLNDAAFPKVEDYVKKARQIHEALRDIPDVRIGIVGVGADLEGRVMGDTARWTEGSLVDAETTQKGRIAVWNNTLQKNLDIYDAVTMHISPPVNAPLEKFTAKTLMEYFFAFNESSSQKLNAQVASFDGKELWVTEWGWLPMAMLDAKGSDRDRFQFLKTPGVAVAKADRLLGMAQIPGVTITSSHDLLGGNGFGVAQAALPGSASPFVRLPVYHVFKEFGELLKTSPVAWRIAATNLPSRPVHVCYTQDTVSLPDIAAYGFGNEKNLIKAVFINRSDKARTIRLETAQLKPEWIYGGENPLPDFLIYPGKFTSPPEVNPEPVIPSSPAAPEVTLPPYSMTVCDVSQGQ